MADQSHIQEQSVQKRAPATIHEEGYTETITGEQFMQEMMHSHRIAQAEQEEQYPVYLDIKRKWHARQLHAEEWEHALYGFSAKVFFLKDGRIGMEYGGRVIIRSIELWMSEQE